MSQIKMPTVTVSMPRLAEGFADGFITVLPDQTDCTAELVTVYWADKAGQRLADYDYLVHARTDGFSFEIDDKDIIISTSYAPTGKPTVLPIPRGRVVPKGAVGLLVEVGAAEAAYVPLPAEPVYLDLGKKAFEFQIMSDLHLNSDRTTIACTHTVATFEDIIAEAHDSVGLMMCGDMTNHGWDEDFDILNALVAEAEGLPPVTYLIGNHDFGHALPDPDHPPYKDFFGEGPLYFDRWISGCHHIFLAFDGVGWRRPIPDEEVAWLREKLAEDADPTKPIFVYCHEPIRNTVAGSTDAGHWWGIENGEEVGKILAAYPQAIFFTGHTHWEFASLDEIYYADERMCNGVNIPCVKELGTPLNRPTADRLTGSEAVFVEVYENGNVLIRGRHTLNHQWVGDYLIGERERNAGSEGNGENEEYAAF